ncbi:MAG: sporulation transcriptional regulator SpoIIID [Clostridia bacterium]|nr:sporulation transcriptional regulator SpoIIID [Clostridia bacterium]
MKHTLDKDRCEILAEYMIERDATVRAAAYAFSVSKSTVHKDVTEKLERVNPDLYDRVRAILLKNKSERHLRGGEATRIKYMRKKGRN